MAKKKSPGIGSNGPLPELSDIRNALATEVLFRERKQLLNEQHKRAKKGFGEKGIQVEDINSLYSLKDFNEAEVEEHFRRKLHTIGAVFTTFTQPDLFKPKLSAPSKQAAFRHLGLMSGLEGKPAIAPPTAVGDDLNQWLEGHTEGADSREAASNEVADIMAEALENGAKGIVTDGTGKKTAEKGAKAAKVREKAKADAEADSPPPPALEVGAEVLAEDHGQPAWKGYSDDPVEWFAEQSRTFSAWFDSLPSGALVAVSHMGVLHAFNARRGDRSNAPMAVWVDGDGNADVESQTQRAERLRAEAGI